MEEKKIRVMILYHDADNGKIVGEADLTEQQVIDLVGLFEENGGEWY